MAKWGTKGMVGKLAPAGLHSTLLVGNISSKRSFVAANFLLRRFELLRRKALGYPALDMWCVICHVS